MEPQYCRTLLPDPRTPPPEKRRLRLLPLCSWRSATVQGALPRGAFPPKCVPKPELRVAADLEALDRLVAARNGCPAVPDDAPIPAQEPVRYLSEWQTFVIRGVIC